MIPKAAIEKSIEGGWSKEIAQEHHDVGTERMIALDPTFWIALGKQLGWKQNGRVTMYQYDGISENPIEVKWTDSMTWAIYAHRFYDLILTGQSTDEYWADLLK